METGEDDEEFPANSIGCEVDARHDLDLADILDLNDNARVIARMDQYSTRKVGAEQCKTKLGAHGSPHRRCGSHCSTTADNPQPPGLLYSPEDTINNDFFYDDEFAVQFDATLGGTEDEIIDSMELNTLLDMTGDDNQHWRSITRMASSKSDSCLYQAELDLSGPSDPIGSSSERELLSSSDLSDFKVEPLFSPPPPHGEMEDSMTGFPSDSLCNEELAGSLVKDEDRFAFNWIAAKDQYMISFDRSPTKYSSDDSYQEPPNKKATKQLTCWGQRSTGNSSSGSGAYSTASSGSRRSSGHLSSVCNSGSAGTGSPGTSAVGTASTGTGTDNGIPVSRSFSPAVPINSDSGRQSSTDTSTSSTMTTWKLVKQQCKSLKDSLPEGMTTWRKVKENGMTGSKTTRSQSMPELQPKDDRGTLEGTSEDPRAEARPKRYSASLLEMYQRMKSCPGEMMAYREPEHVDPTPIMQFEMDTWSISPLSSHQFSPMSECAKGVTDNSLVKWNTQKNLNGTVPCNSAVGDQRTQVDNMEMAVQAGSMLSDSHKRLKTRDSIAVQYPPMLNDCAIQTSIESTSKSNRKTQANKSLQTSVELLTAAHWNVQRSVLRRMRHSVRTRPHSAGSLTSKYPDDDPFTVKLSKHAKERMTQSLFFHSTELPDLSFLKKETSCSLANITKAIAQCSAGTAPAIEQAPVSQKKTPPNNTNDNTKKSSSSRSATGYRPKKPPRQSRPQSACLAQSRESSPLLIGGKLRSRSSDSASSFCSSSSSGIDPGSYDSLTNRNGHYFTSRREENRKSSDANARVIMAKDLKPMANKAVFWPVRSRVGCSPKVCNICQAQRSSHRDDLELMVASHPGYHKESDCGGNREMIEFRSWEGCDCHKRCHCSCIRMCAPPSHCHCVPASTGCHVHTPSCCTTEYSRECRRAPNPTKVSPTGQVRLRRDCHTKPLKSCLVKDRKVNRKLLAFKHRSWSDPSDGLVLKYSQEGQIKYQLVTHDKECSRRQPLAEINVQTHPDTATEEHAKKTMVENTTNTCVKPVASPVKNIDGIILLSKRSQSTPSNSPEQIPIPACTCGTTHAVLHSSSDSGDGGNQGCSDFYKSKKSVSFSEEVCYHSPYQSPHQSPRRRVRPLVGKDTGTGVVIRHPLGRLANAKKRPVSLPPDFRMIISKPLTQTIAESPGCESPPKEFKVSPLSSVSLSPSPTRSPSLDLMPKKELLHDIMKATEKLLHHFGQTRDLNQKMELGSTGTCPEVGHLVLEHLCPAVYAVILDGLKPFVRSLFGKVKNSVWRVVEDSLDAGPSSHIIRDLVHDLKTLDFLTTSWLKFNAFVFGLLNHKALDLWLSQLQSSDRLLSKHYDNDAFLYLSLTSAKPLFLDLVTVLQPLAQMPFRLEYNFEFRQLEGRQHQQLSDNILDRHVSRSDEGQLENRQWRLYQQQNERIRELAQSDSPVPGEISPIQGQKGKAEGVLHHSAPDVYQQTKVVQWSPTRTSWHSLYDRIQEQTKLMVTDTGRQILQSLKDSKKIKLSKGALQTLGQDLVQVAVGYSSPVRALPSVPGLTSSDDTVVDQSIIADTSASAARSAHKLRKLVATADPLVISDPVTSSDEDQQSEGLLKKVAERWFNSPQKVYKKGVTEYKFRDERDSQSPESKTGPSNSKPGYKMQKAVSLDTAGVGTKDTEKGSSCRQKSMFDEDGLPRSSSMDQTLVPFCIPSRSESLDSGRNDMAASRTERGPNNGSLEDDSSTRNNKSSSSDQLRPSQTLSRTLSTSLKKSWSSFGPSLVNWMDRLLLEDPMKNQGPMKTSKSDSEATTDTARAPGSRPPLRRSMTVPATETCTDGCDRQCDHGNQSTTRPTALEISDESVVVTEATEPTGQDEYNWFVQALCHHVAMQQDQLSFTKGTVLAVIKQVDSDWLLCRQGDKQGLVHIACVSNA